MRGNRIWLLAIALASAVLYCGPGFGQAIISEDFTSTGTANAWYYFNGACLTAGTAAGTGTAGTVAGKPPGCTADGTYYQGTGDSVLVGGYHGTATGSTAFNSATALDPSGFGALRFTNGCINSSVNSCGSGSGGGHSQNGLIISGSTYDTDQGLDITFKTVTYRGDSGGNGASCPSGSTASNNECISTTTVSPNVAYSCPSGYTQSGSGSGSTCSELLTASPTVGYSCPSGYTASGSGASTTCSKTVTTSSVKQSNGTYLCPAGYTPTGTVSKNTTCSETVTTTPTKTYTCPSGYTSSGSGAGTTCSKTVTTTPTQTYSCPSGYTQSGSGSGTTCTLTTVVSTTSPNQKDGADGMSFFLMDGSQPVTFSDGSGNYGSWGGSLGYTCSNANPPYNGLVGAYIGLGIDEYGNFLNGTVNTFGVSNPQNLGDNTASGGGQQANRIGLRGEGNVSWEWLNANYPNYYPSSLATTKDSNGKYYSQDAVQATCKTGTLWNYSVPAVPVNTLATSANGGATLYDYKAIPGAYTVLPGTVQIANEYANGGYSRQPYSTTSGTYGTGANPITYKLQITANGLLSLSYSFNGGAWTSVIKNQSISASNGTLPSKVRFGFAGSTGGSSNIHEILCFKAAAASQAASSTTINQQQSSKVETGSQAYFGYYDPQNWTGALTANSLINTNGVLTISSAANWDASCVLTGVASGSSCGTTGQAGPISAQSWSTGSGGRVMLTWSGTAGIPLEWSSLTSTEQADLDAGDSSQTADRLQFLRGDAAEEIQGGGTYRNLDSVLGDIIDSSSAWVGPPSKSVYAAYESPTTWKDKLYPSTTMPENSGQSYSTFVSTESTRLNVVYVGANDGLLHGFSAGSFDSTGTVYNSATNTGQEVLAYMPQGVLETIHSSSTPYIDYANAQYGHNFYVDATPGTGDLYYQGAWHTWLVGGLGPGGAEIYALKITNPSNFSESNASSMVMGDWQGGTNATSNPGSFTCQYVANCALNLGDTYGTPTIRRLHNGDWGVIFGNGLNSSTGDAGIFILTIDPTSGAQNMYYLSTGTSGGNGIAYAHPVDMDQDHVVDYVYAGDALGNVWRFDLTSSSPQDWGVTPGPLFTTSSGQPITSDVYPVFVAGPSGTQLMLFFGTGRKYPLTETTPTSYSSSQQSYYGIWDWNMSAWNALNSTQFASMPAGTVGSLGPSNLQLQTVSYDSSTGLPSIETPYSVCWAGTSTCSAATVTAGTSSTSSNNQYGWYINFPGTNSGYGSTTYEQEVYNPILVSTAIQFNSILPAIDSPLMCTPDQDEGWSYALDVRNGTPVGGFFVNNGNTKTIALQTNASGSSSEVTATTSSGGTNYYLIYQSTSGGAGTPTQIQPANNVTGYRETWIQLR
ncbi:MAG TPA: PilC/PilY family type IV pilus protein [Steroidobacteraceae bacterium]|nr:PilC/PilY family type IV pilus protein [Steroidobacteraceae bacterium]